ncbi:MAG: hypothetical protein M3Q07_23320 [Pseudobdellovibrionaceae bacterium]|nr:hypothetical protein [Pseudobdellovibrionaceae bacterium]
MVIDLTDLFMQMRRHRSWARAELVPSIDPTGVHMRTDEYGRLIRFEDYGQMDVFGWLIVEQLPVNHRSCWLLHNHRSGGMGYKSPGFQSPRQRTSLVRHVHPDILNTPDKMPLIDHRLNKL